MQLAEHIGIDGSAVTRLVDRLEAKQLLVRCHDRVDGRSVKIALTPKGDQLIPKLIELSQQANQQFLSCLSDLEAELFEKLIQKVFKHLETPTTFTKPIDADDLCR